jgi:hypothetical protein
MKAIQITRRAYWIKYTTVISLLLSPLFDGLSIPKDIHPVVSTSTLIWFIRYIHVCELQFLSM